MPSNVPSQGNRQSQDQQRNIGSDRQQETSTGRGFASMNPERQREIASMGGRASSGNFANNPDRAAEAGRRGGQTRGQREKEDKGRV